MLAQLLKRTAPLAALALGASLSGCAYVTDWEYDVSGVALDELDLSGDPPTEIALAGPDKIVIVDGTGLDIALEGSAEAGEALRFDRDGDSLTIARDSKIYNGSGVAIVRVSMPAPEEIAVAGSGSIEAASVATRSELAIGGSGDISVKAINAESLEVAIGGSGEVKGAGTAERLEISIGGSGDVDLSELTADDVEVAIGGSGDVALRSDGKVEASIAGSGDVRVIGSAKCTVSAMGSGTLTCTPS